MRQSANTISQASYASRIIGVTSIGFAKLSVAFLYKRLVLYPSWRINLIPLLSSAGWMLFAILAFAFQCHLPSPWLISSTHCPSGSSITIAVAVFNCLTDAVLVTYPAWALYTVVIPTGSRITVMSLFASRI